MFFKMFKIGQFEPKYTIFNNITMWIFSKTASFALLEIAKYI